MTAKVKDMTNKIKTRESYLIVQDLGSEILIYDLKINKILRLNETVAIVWRLCDGEKTVAEISKIMSDQLNTNVSEDLVWLAIDELKRENLLANPEAVRSKSERDSRREIIWKVGLATMVAFPVINSIVAPSSVAAQSGACISSGQQVCIEPQPDIETCFNGIDAAAVGRCCVETVVAYTFNRNTCCGICGIPNP